MGKPEIMPFYKIGGEPDAKDAFARASVGNVQIQAVAYFIGNLARRQFTYLKEPFRIGCRDPVYVFQGYAPPFSQKARCMHYEGRFIPPAPERHGRKKRGICFYQQRFIGDYFSYLAEL